MDPTTKLFSGIFLMGVFAIIVQLLITGGLSNLINKIRESIYR